MSVNKNDEYTMLRQEILNLITCKENYIIAMNTITVAILCVGFELRNPIVFLAPYVILFAFQNVIKKRMKI